MSDETSDISNAGGAKRANSQYLANLQGLIGALKTPWTLVIALPLVVCVLDPDQVASVVSFAVKAFFGTLPYIAFAVGLIAYLKAAGAEKTIATAFTGQENRMIVFAALFGGLAPFCSCEVIPFVAGLLAVGAPLSAIMAFWLSSPLIDPPTLLITASALGWPFAIGKALAAVALGLAGGFIIKGLVAGGAFQNIARAKTKTGCCGCGPSPLSGQPEWRIWTFAERRAEFRGQLLENALFLMKWLALAYVLEALMVHYVPADMIAGLVGGDGVVPIAIGALVGAPAYLNSYVAPPLVAGLMEQGMSSGAAMAFIVAGAVSSIPAMAAVWSLVRAPVFATYLSLGIGGAFVFGLLYALFVGG